MASYNKSIMASVFEDTNTHQRFGEAMSNTHQRFGEAMSKTWRRKADSLRQARLFTVANAPQLDLVM